MWSKDNCLVVWYLSGNYSRWKLASDHPTCGTQEGSEESITILRVYEKRPGKGGGRVVPETFENSLGFCESSSIHSNILYVNFIFCFYLTFVVVQSDCCLTADGDVKSSEPANLILSLSETEISIELSNDLGLIFVAHCNGVFCNRTWPRI